MYLRSLLLLSALISCNTSYAALFDDEDERKKYRAGQQEQSRLQEARIVKLEEVTNQAIIGLHNQIEELRREFSKLNGQIEVLANDIQLSQNRQKDFYIDLDSRLRRIEQPVVGSDTDSSVVEGAPVAVAAVVAVPVPPVAAVVAVPLVPVASDTVATDAESSDYQEAFNMFKIGRFKGAISKFKSFIENYPTSKLLPSSHYWIGNSYYAMRDFKRAIYVQQELVKDFPDSVKVPDAMLNIASSQKEINYTTASQKTLKDLIAKYPISEAAKKAKLRLVD
ncbi:MAG: tol-pal system protein YbgF [Nitrosomonadaceae bacterium]|nr:tol-pal system protein YbgF [Nitrosomonadaceae bacterium]